jgi:hypothetical protein
VGPFSLHQLVHPADVLMADLAGELQLVAEPVDRFLIRSDFGLDDLQGDLFLKLEIKGSIELAHPPLAQFFDDLVSPHEDRAQTQFLGGGTQGHSTGGRSFGGEELGPALPAEPLGIGIISLTFRTLYLSLCDFSTFLFFISLLPSTFWLIKFIMMFL